MNNVIPIGWWTFWLVVGFAGYAVTAWILIRIAAARDAEDGAREDGRSPRAR